MVLQTFLINQLNSTLVIATTIAVGGLVYAYYVKKKNIPKQWSVVGKVKQLYLYPLKSGRRREIQNAECTTHGTYITENGIELEDRCFIVYGQNEVKAATTFPKLILVETSINAKGEIIFTAPERDPLIVKLANSKSNTTPVSLFRKETVPTLDCGEKAAIWFSEYLLNKPSGLHLGYHSRRNYKRNIINSYPKYRIYPGYEESTAIYHNLGAHMLVNQSSVYKLNEKIGNTDINAINFRPTILIDGPGAFDEESWDWIKIGDAVFRNVKPCTRCAITTIDPESGIFNKLREPLKTLTQFNTLKDPVHVQSEGKKPVMGIYLVLKQLGKISVGDEIYVA